MIRINLLGVERAPVKGAGGFQLAQRLTLACSLILVATVLGIGWWYWSLQAQSRALDESLVEARRETDRLRTVLQEVKKFEDRQTQLQQRVALIEELRKGQTGPVHLLDVVSRSMPDLLWLVELKQDAANATVMDGRAMSLPALSDFVANLESSGYFQKPVEIIDSQVESTPQGDVVKFTVKGTFMMPDPGHQ